MNKLLNQIEQGLRRLAGEIEDKMDWGDMDFSDIILEIRQYADDIKTIKKAIPDLSDLKSIADYQEKAEKIVENQINKTIENNK
jgi:hypothetical protein